jgi:hypothetical protein
MTRTIADAEQALAAAREGADSLAIAAAQERLALTRQTAAAATEAAKEQARQRDLEARGLNKSLFEPPANLKDQLQQVRDAFDAGEITRQQAATAFNNLTKSAVETYKNIQAELAAPANRALEASDVRTQAGASEFIRLASGRQDPAIDQMREQLKELREVKQAVRSVFPLEVVKI